MGWLVPGSWVKLFLPGTLLGKWYWSVALQKWVQILCPLQKLKQRQDDFIAYHFVSQREFGFIKSTSFLPVSHWFPKCTICQLSLYSSLSPYTHTDMRACTHSHMCTHAYICTHACRHAHAHTDVLASRFLPELWTFQLSKIIIIIFLSKFVHLGHRPGVNSFRRLPPILPGLNDPLLWPYRSPLGCRT